MLPGALAAFAAWTAHAAVDWDWELTGVTLVALLSGAALVASARDDDDLAGIPVALVVTSVSVLLAAFAILTALGNVPLGRARDALASSDYALAKAEARRARRWAPWSAEPLRILGEAQLNDGESQAARDSLRRALKKEPINWELWVDLALVTSGPERKAAIRRAAQLNPLSTQVQQLLATL